MSMSEEIELQRLEAEVKSLTAYVSPHDHAEALMTLASVVGVCAGCVFLLAGVIQGQVRFANLMWMTVLAALIVYLVTWEFRWGRRVLTVSGIATRLVRQAISVPHDVDEVRMRLVLCKARIAHLKRSRR